MENERVEGGNEPTPSTALTPPSESVSSATESGSSTTVTSDQPHAQSRQQQMGDANFNAGYGSGAPNANNNNTTTTPTPTSNDVGANAWRPPPISTANVGHVGNSASATPVMMNARTPNGSVNPRYTPGGSSTATSPHRMQFPYASSNFVTPSPTPIRPLPGDPRMGPTTPGGHAGGNSGASGDGSNVPPLQQQQQPPTPQQATMAYGGGGGSASQPTAPTGGPMFGMKNENQWQQPPTTQAMGMQGRPMGEVGAAMGGWNPANKAMTDPAQQVPQQPVQQQPQQPMDATPPMASAPAPPTGPAGDPVIPMTPFTARSLTPKRVEGDVYILDPNTTSQLVAYGKSVQTPVHAATFATDLLRASIDDSGRLGAHGWRVPYQPNEYEVLLHKGSIGLCMNMSVRMGYVSVTSFRRPDGGVIGPAEASGMIRIGDDLIAVDGFPIQSPDDFSKVVGRLKSLRPVLLRFRRPGSMSIDTVTPDPAGYRRGLRSSMAALDNSELVTAGMWHMGVRYLGVKQWAAELHVDGGGIRRIGILPTEREAAIVYNRYIGSTYGQGAAQFMNPAGSASMDPQQAGLPVSMSNVRDMKPIQRIVRRQKAAFTNEQKEQLRAQIMVFKFTSTGGIIPNDLLSRALKSTAHGHIQEGADKRKRKTFSAQPLPKQPKKKAKRGRGKKKKQYSDESDEPSGSDEDAPPPVREPVAPTRRSGRNAGKAQKSYVTKEKDSDFEFSDDEKPAKTAAEPEAPKGPQIDKIVGVRFHRESKDDDDATMEFLIKWKDTSYLHLTWLTTNDIEEFGHHSVMRMRRYMQKHSRDVEQARENVVVGDERDLSSYFSDAFLEIDRIIDMKEVEEPDEVNPYILHKDESPTMKRGKKYLVKWRDLSYVDCTWEWEDKLTDDRKIAAYHRYNHPPVLQGAHPAMFEDIRPDPASWAKYQESPTYNNQNTLRSYQLEGLNWMVFCWYNRRNCILADEMGLGKTVQATSILEHLRQREHIRGPFLVIAPLATLGNWKREIETWTSMNCLLYHDSEGGADIRAFIREKEFYYPNEMYKRRGVYKFNVLVTSYQTLMADAEFLDCIHWRYIVIDEAHKLKNREAKLLQCLQNFTMDSCLLMTGTPLQNGVYELWCLLNFIEPEKFPSQQEFYDEYGELNTAEQVARLHEQLRPYMLRRVKEDVEKSIPPKEETIIDVELTTLQKKYYRAIFERNRAFLNQGASGTVANLVNVEMELRKCCNHPFLIRGAEEKECAHLDEQQRAKILVQASGKTVLLDKMLAKFRAEKKKVLIFSQFKIMLDIIEDLCTLRHYSIERMDGSVRGNSRQAAIDRFNNLESDTFAFLLSTRAGGVGINLIAASVVILFDSDWNPQNDLQAVARCHRIGQTQSVNIYRLVTKKTYENQMFEIASKKLGMHHAVFETGGVRNEFDGEEDSGNMMSLMSLDREKVEMMIRYGAYAIMDNEDEQDPENRAINELDIDQLLSSSRTIRYDPTGGDNAEAEEGEDGESKPVTASQSSALSFSKASFTAESSDTTIDFNDEQFWEKVLGPKTVQVLMTKVQEGWLSSATKDEVKGFLSELRDLAREVVKERQRGGTMADVDQVMSILIELKVTGPIIKNVVNVRQVAAEWLEVIERPKRRRNQDAESELMYLEFLDGTKKEVPTKKQKNAPSGRRSKTKGGERRRSEPLFESDDDADHDEDDEPSTPVRKPKRAKRQSTGASSSSSSKSGIRVTLRKTDDDDFSVVKVQSSIKKVQTSLRDDSDAVAGEPKPKGREKAHAEDGSDSAEDEQGREEPSEEEREKEDELEDPEDEDDAEEEEEAEEEDDDESDDDDDDEEVNKKRKPKASRKRKNGRVKSEASKSHDHDAPTDDPQNESEMWCRVCYSDQGFMDDPIVQCERCSVAVHKYCYGIDEVPDGDAPWYCDYCADSSESASDATCALCPLKRRTSAFKKTCEGDWVHVVCALWAPGVQFADVERMKEVKNVPEAIKETRGEHCAVCKEKDGCIKCFRGSCLMYFHPLCGRESKGEFDMYMNEAGQLRAFCPKHRSKSRRA